MCDYDFSELTDFDLVRLQQEVRRFPEDKEFLDAILKELGRRQRANEARLEVRDVARLLK